MKVAALGFPGRGKLNMLMYEKSISFKAKQLEKQTGRLVREWNAWSVGAKPGKGPILGGQTFMPQTDNPYITIRGQAGGKAACSFLTPLLLLCFF